MKYCSRLFRPIYGFSSGGYRALQSMVFHQVVIGLYNQPVISIETQIPTYESKNRYFFPILFAPLKISRPVRQKTGLAKLWSYFHRRLLISVFARPGRRKTAENPTNCQGHQANPIKHV